MEWWCIGLPGYSSCKLKYCKSIMPLSRLFPVAACLCMWNFSMVLRCMLFLWNCTICMTSCDSLSACECSRRCEAYAEELLLCIKERLCWLIRVLKSRPVWHTYAFPQSVHVSL
jgi:hypothetical protein